jgi:small subunit ribosomal protein S15
MKMILTAEKKKEAYKKFGKSEKDTGAAEAQIALFTERISHLTAHLGKQKKDVNTQRALINMVGKRKSLLNYLHKTNITRYRAILKDLDIRK